MIQTTPPGSWLNPGSWSISPGQPPHRTDLVCNLETFTPYLIGDLVGGVFLEEMGFRFSDLGNILEEINLLFENEEKSEPDDLD